MPGLPRPRTDVAHELVERALAAGRERALAALDRLESLAAEIEPDALYPEDELLQRLTGVPAGLDTPAVIVGAALLTDLSAIAERISAAIGLAANELPDPPVSVRELASRWGVSVKTIERYRRSGLVARRVVGGRGGPNLVFTPRAVTVFEARRPAKLARARNFRRVEPAEDARIVRTAERARARFGWSLNETARRLASRVGRSHEGVRQILRRADAARETPIFSEPKPPTERDRRALALVSRRGIEPADLADRTGRSKASVRRAIELGRRDLLRGWVPERTDASMPPAQARLVLDSPHARKFVVRVAPTTLGELLRVARERAAPIAVEERARVGAIRALTARASALLHDGSGGANELDEAETALRWASLLKADVLAPHLPLLVESIDALGFGPAETWSAPLLTRALGRLVAGASSSVDRHDPARGGRLAGQIGIAAQRALTELGLPRAAEASTDGRGGRALRQIPGGFGVFAWTHRLDPWQRLLAHDPRWPGVVDRLGDDDRAVLCARYGLSGEPPRTRAEAAQSLGTTRMHVARRERTAVRSALALARTPLPSAP